MVGHTYRTWFATWVNCCLPYMQIGQSFTARLVHLDGLTLPDCLVVDTFRDWELTLKTVCHVGGINLSHVLRRTFRSKTIWAHNSQNNGAVQKLLGWIKLAWGMLNVGISTLPTGGKPKGEKRTWRWIQRNRHDGDNRRSPRSWWQTKI